MLLFVNWIKYIIIFSILLFDKYCLEIISFRVCFIFIIHQINLLCKKNANVLEKLINPFVFLFILLLNFFLFCQEFFDKEIFKYINIELKKMTLVLVTIPWKMIPPRVVCSIRTVLYKIVNTVKNTF